MTYDAKQKKGWYPDALVPFKASAIAGENKITKNQNFGIWFTFKIPDNTVAGLYTTSFTLSLDGIDWLIPVEVEVYDFALPKENHVKTAFAIWIDDMCDIWGNANPDIHKVENNAEVLSLLNSYTDMLSDYRVSSTALPLLWGDLENSAKVVEAAIAATKNDKIASYSIPVKQIETDDGISKTKFKEVVTALIKASSNQLNLLRKAYLYIPKIDEPLYQNLIPLAKRVNEIVEEVRNELLANETLWQGKDDVKVSLQRLQHVLTADYDTRLFGITQTWCPYFSDFHTKEKRDLYYDRRDTYNEGLWWYGGVGPKYPQPTFHMNNNIASARTIGWMQNIYKIDGQLYWTVNLSRQMKSDHQYHLRDIWNTAYSFYDVAGDGYLVYPGEIYGIDNLSLDNYVEHLSSKLFSGTIPSEVDSNISLAKSQLSSLIMLAKNDIIIKKNGNKLQIHAPNSIAEIIANGSQLQGISQGSFKIYELAMEERNTFRFKINNQTISAEYTK